MLRFLRYIIVVPISILTALAVNGQALPQPPVFEVRQMTFSSSVFNDMSPVVVRDGIIFCSDKRISGISDKTTYNDMRLFYLYFAERKDSAKWESPNLINTSGTPLISSGPLSLAADGKTVYFTSNVLSGKAAKKRGIKNPMGIFSGELSGNTSIINVQPFEYNNQQYSMANPSVSRDGKWLYFASDKPGGQGGWDIYYCEMINSKWSAPVNPGNRVNSPSDENFPFIHPSGRLYYSSNRPGGDGGMDIYYSMPVTGSWETPFHLQADLNSPSDDFAFVADDNLLNGYFASRRGRTNDDIFGFTSRIVRKVKCDTLEINSYCYRFTEENAVKFDSIPFKYQWNFGDGEHGTGKDTIHCYKGPGDYTVILDVINLVTNEIHKNEKILLVEVRDVVQPYISCPNIFTAGSEIKVNADSTNLPGWNITQYYWNFGDETVGKGKEFAKTYLKSGIFNVQLIVTAQPDTDGGVREACVSKNITVIR